MLENIITVKTKHIEAIIGKEELKIILDKNLIKNVQKYILITISDPIQEDDSRKELEDIYCKQFKNYYRLKMWDITKQEVKENGEILNEISLKEVEKLSNFILENIDSKFIINCNAGISRSAGVGLLIEFLAGGFQNLYEFKTNWEDVISKHYRYSPNLIIIDKYEEINKKQLKNIHKNFNIYDCIV